MGWKQPPEAPRWGGAVMINDCRSPPSPCWIRGHFPVSGFTEFELKGSKPIPSARGFSVVGGFF